MINPLINQDRLAGRGDPWHVRPGMPQDRRAAAGACLSMGDAPRTLAGLESVLAYSSPAGKGKHGRTPDLLRPTRPGGALAWSNAATGRSGLLAWITRQPQTTPKPAEAPVDSNGFAGRHKLSEATSSGGLGANQAGSSPARPGAGPVSVGRGGRKVKRGVNLSTVQWRFHLQVNGCLVPLQGQSRAYRA